MYLIDRVILGFISAGFCTVSLLLAFTVEGDILWPARLMAFGIAGASAFGYLCCIGLDDLFATLNRSRWTRSTS